MILGIVFACTLLLIQTSNPSELNDIVNWMQENSKHILETMDVDNFPVFSKSIPENTVDPQELLFNPLGQLGSEQQDSIFDLECSETPMFLGDPPCSKEEQNVVINQELFDPEKKTSDEKPSSPSKIKKKVSKVKNKEMQKITRLTNNVRMLRGKITKITSNMRMLERKISELTKQMTLQDMRLSSMSKLTHVTENIILKDTTSNSFINKLHISIRKLIEKCSDAKKTFYFSRLEKIQQILNPLEILERIDFPLDFVKIYEIILGQVPYSCEVLNKGSLSPKDLDLLIKKTDFCVFTEFKKSLNPEHEPSLNFDYYNMSLQEYKKLQKYLVSTPRLILLDNLFFCSNVTQKIFFNLCLLNLLFENQTDDNLIFKKNLIWLLIVQTFNLCTSSNSSVSFEFLDTLDKLDYKISKKEKSHILCSSEHRKIFHLFIWGIDRSAKNNFFTNIKKFKKFTITRNNVSHFIISLKLSLYCRLIFQDTRNISEDQKQKQMRVSKYFNEIKCFGCFWNELYELINEISKNERRDQHTT